MVESALREIVLIIVRHNYQRCQTRYDNLSQGAAGTDSSFHRIRTSNCEVDKTADRKNETQSGVIADLLDLQFELNSLQQGIHQMDKITPENPVPSTDDLFETDPFGDSFANMKVRLVLRLCEYLFHLIALEIKLQ